MYIVLVHAILTKTSILENGQVGLSERFLEEEGTVHGSDLYLPTSSSPDQLPLDELHCSSDFLKKEKNVEIPLSGLF